MSLANHNFSCCIINQKQAWFPSLLDVLLTRSLQLSWGLVCQELSPNEQSGFINRSAALTRALLPDAAGITRGLVHKGNSLIWGQLGSHPLSRTSPCLWNFRGAVGMPTDGVTRTFPCSSGAGLASSSSWICLVFTTGVQDPGLIYCFHLCLVQNQQWLLSA